MARLRSKRKPATATKAPLTPEERRQQTFQRAAKLLAAKSRSLAELRDLLLERQGATKANVEEVLERLTEYGYLNDERFAISYASAKVRQRPIGRQRLKRDLALKKVSKETADEALDLVFAETPESELIDRAIEKRVRLRGRPENRAQAKSLFDHLLRQGFPFELVAEKVRAVAQATIDDDEL
ncbi:MAG: regulatory protein RecX [Pyrinomonadaceae bacterium]